MKTNESSKRKIKDVVCALCDEISMWSYNNLSAANIRLNEIMGCHDNQTYFGGLMVILFGDFGQLPPVNGRSVYDPNACKSGGVHLYLDLFQSVVLNSEENFRAENTFWLAILNKVRFGIVDEDVKKKLCSLKREFNDEKHLVYDEAIEKNWPALFGKKKDRDRFNERRVREIFDAKKELSLFVIQRHVNEHPKNSDILRQMPKKVLLFEGAKVMCLSNQSVASGIVNGTIGFVKNIVCDINDMKESTRMIEFGNITCIQAAVPEYVEIANGGWNGKVECMTYKEANAGRLGSFKMIPLELAYAITIHKSQAMTFEGGIADIGESLFDCGGLVYTALSRFKTDQKLVLLSVDFTKIKPPVGALEEMERLEAVKIN